MTTGRSAERQVTALVTRPGAAGPELLCFEHPSAGVQLPTGSVEPGQSFAVAARRVAWSETGVLGLEPVGEVGGLRRRGQDHRLVHLRATVEMPESWLVLTPTGGGVAWWCFWASVADAHALVHEHHRDGLDTASAALASSARTDVAPRARPLLPAELLGVQPWEQFWAPGWSLGFAGRRYHNAWRPDGDGAERCTRARAVCVTDDGLVVVVRTALGVWEIPGGGREPGESVEDSLRREIREEASARTLQLELLATLRSVELDGWGAPLGAPFEQAYFWARVALEGFDPTHETVERRALPAHEAADLVLLDNEFLFTMAARVDPRLDRTSESR
jgi:8-oxo-dGTP pyrophosphatase MutT (NUDIX family)